MKQLLISLALRMLRLVYSRPLGTQTQRETELIDELRDTFNRLPDIDTESSTPSEVKWASNMKNLEHLVLNSNPRDFLRWEVIMRTMFVSLQPYVYKELKLLKKQPDWTNRWSKAIVESRAGHPDPSPWYHKSSGNLIHHAYQLCMSEKTSGKRVEDFRLVFEFGGGYGSMCRLFHNLGFQGVYVIFDLPPFSALQRYYLKSIGIQLIEKISVHEKNNGVLCLDDFGDLGDLLNSFDSDNYDESLFVATWSLSEAPVKFREKVLHFLPLFQDFMIGYQDLFEGVDNIKYFKEMRATLINVKWENFEIPFLPGNYFLFGSREDNPEA